MNNPIATGLSPQHIAWLAGHDRSPRPGPLFSTAALLTTLCFVTGMALWGTHPQAGYFYAAGMVIGTPVLWAMRPWEATLPKPIRIYAAFYVGFLLMCTVHALFRDASPGTIEYAALRPRRILPRQPRRGIRRSPRSYKDTFRRGGEGHQRPLRMCLR